MRLCKVFANNSSANTKLSKAQLHKIGQSEGFLGRFLGPLLKTGLPLTKKALKTLAKSVLIQLGLTATASVIDAAMKSLESTGLLKKGVSETTENEVK